MKKVDKKQSSTHKSITVSLFAILFQCNKLWTPLYITTFIDNGSSNKNNTVTELKKHFIAIVQRNFEGTIETNSNKNTLKTSKCKWNE